MTTKQRYKTFQLLKDHIVKERDQKLEALKLLYKDVSEIAKAAQS